jgi:hypothetical protein
MIFCAIVISLSVLGLLSYTIKVETNAKKKYKQLGAKIAQLEKLETVGTLRMNGYKPAYGILKETGKYYLIESDGMLWAKEYAPSKEAARRRK